MCMVQSYTHIRSCIHTAAISWGCLCTHQRFHTQCTVHVLCMLVNMYVVMHAHYMCGHVCMNDQWTISPRKKVDLHVTVIHCTGCISVNRYQASRAAQGSWRRPSHACWSWARRSHSMYCICTATCLLPTGALCATSEWIYPATTEHSLQVHLLLIFLSILLQHGHSVQSEHRNFTPRPLTVVVIGLEMFLKQ